MHVRTVSYSKTFVLGAYTNERIGVEFELDKGDSEIKALAESKKLVEKFHRTNNPQLYENNVQVTQQEKVVEIERVKEQVQSTKDKILEGISAAKELTVLKSYELLSKKYPDLKEAYLKKLNELNNENKTK